MTYGGLLIAIAVCILWHIYGYEQGLKHGRQEEREKWMGFCEFEDKAKFVTHKLLPMIIAANCGIVGLEFKYEDGNETITAVYEDGTLQDIDVTGDSLAMMALDVLENIGC